EPTHPARGALARAVAPPARRPRRREAAPPAAQPGQAPGRHVGRALGAQPGDGRLLLPVRRPRSAAPRHRQRHHRSSPRAHPLARLGAPEAVRPPGRPAAGRVHRAARGTGAGRALRRGRRAGWRLRDDTRPSTFPLPCPFPSTLPLPLPFPIRPGTGTRRRTRTRTGLAPRTPPPTDRFPTPRRPRLPAT